MDMYSGPVSSDMAISSYFANVYKWMTLALGITAFVAWMISQNPAISGYLELRPMLIWGLFAVEVGLVFYLSARAHQMSFGAASAVFLLYSVLNGVTLSFIFSIYTTASIVQTFLIATAMYGVMALYGYATKRDLSGLGSFFFMALIGIIIASVVNLWLASPMIQWVTTVGGVIIFAGLTAYDHQQLKALAVSGGPASLAIVGALTLYLDFINLFLYLLRLFGSREE